MRSLLAGLSLVALVMLGCDSSSGPDYGEPETMTKVSGDETTANAGAAVTPAPSVRITDIDGRPVPGVEVTFTVATGSGTVAGASVETNTLGVAAVGGWTLGTIGANSLTASSPNLTPVTFSSTAVCASIGTLVLDGEVSGSLASGDCRYSQGYLTDRYTFVLAAPTAVRLTQSSSAIDSYLELVSAGTVVAFHDDVSQANLNSSVRVLLPAGSYQVGASSALANEEGGYTLGAESATTDLTDCDFLFVVPGITATQQLDVTDCPSDGPDVFYFEAFLVWLKAGEVRTFTMSSGAFDAYLFLARQGTTQLQIVAEDDDGGGGTNSRITYTAPASGFYVVFTSNALPSTAGAYTLTVQ